MELRYFIIRRLLLLIPTIIGLSIFMFILIEAVPKSVITSPYINIHSTIPRAIQVQNALKVLDLNYPAPIAYLFYLARLLHGNLGIMSLPGYPTSVAAAIAEAFPNTIQLTLFAALLSIIIAIPLGTYIGARPNSVADQSGRIFSLTGYAMPAFWLALLLQLGLGKGTITGNPVGVFPISGAYNPNLIPFPTPSWFVNGYTLPTHLVIFDSLIHGDIPLFYDSLLHLVLPVLTLTYGILAGLLRFIRAGMVDSSNQEFVKTARAKGVPEKLVIKKHIRKNALIPTVTVMGLLVAGLLSGVVLVEDVFAYPGIGFLTTEAILSYQIWAIIGSTLIFGLVLVLANLIVDVVYALIDPRIRY
ncbi:MAG: ABC transporter permease [Candidatus Thermoplasmatota archaeon]|jgi:peptide/nickel transport system permease protein|nr:ABC transporter permease [Candidatus Thermoplasmatota archaeon]